MKNQFTVRCVLIAAAAVCSGIIVFGQAPHNHNSGEKKMEKQASPAIETANNRTKSAVQSEKDIINSTPALARAGFESFKKLDGKWIGRSTKGWTEQINFKTIAQGSVIVEDSFDAHPNETMMTMFHLDGDRLMLTHYCVSKTQPRLLATSFSEDGKTITFTFLDATNLASRDKGHMDKAIFKFIDEDTVTSQWTWYQGGKESWMEEIRYERVKEK